MNEDEFIKELNGLNIKLSDKQISDLKRYYELLIEWNEKINLTRITEKKDVYLKHFYDSLTLSKIVNLNDNLKLCDIGTGAGFPGLVLKIVFPTLSITLVDALQKRINFLNEVIKELNLKNIETIHVRAEDFIKEHKGQYDIVTSRAVARLKKLVDYCTPLLNKNGVFLPMKANCEDEINEIKNNKAIKIIRIEKFNLPIENSNRTIIEIKKNI